MSPYLFPRTLPLREVPSVIFSVPSTSNAWTRVMANKTELLKFLDHHVFDPILKASADNYREADKKKLQDVQDRTKSEKDRFHHYSSAKEIIDNYKSDLHSSTAKRVNSELEELKLPTLPSVKHEFLRVAGDDEK